MRSMMALLAALCLLLGLFPGVVIHLLKNVSATTLGDGAFEPLIQFSFGSEKMVAVGMQLPTAMPAYFLVAVAIGIYCGADQPGTAER
ncbi:MAG: hypothetical protein IPK16_29215 [Anaerolineales bacterium]|nr:hypothetical protein [Anaerolineales bacterium]